MSRRLALPVLILILLVPTACTVPAAGGPPDRSSPVPTAAQPPPATGSSATAAQLTAELRRARVVAGRPEVPGYEREAFGQSWSDDHGGRGGHNGCDTRNDVLAVQLTDVRYRSGSRCVVVAGTLRADPYTGRRTVFAKAQASKVQIDHVYPLARAWDFGASRWPAQRRVDFANDQTSNLLAVDGPTNASKGDRSPGEWLPLNRPSRCAYVLRYLQVARKYALPITTTDRDTTRTLTPTCS